MVDYSGDEKSLSLRLRPRLRANLHKEAMAAARLGKQIGTASNTNPSRYVPGYGRGHNSLMPTVMGRSQRSTVIVRYASSTLPGSWKMHGLYLARENAQTAGKHGLGFDGLHEDITVARLLDSWQASGNQRLWKIIISPEFGGMLDLREHTRQLVTQMEHDLDTPLEWVAVDHYNTETPHVHLLVRGVDDRGQKLDIARSYIHSGIRQRSCEVATRQLGIRTDGFNLLARERQVTSNRFTALDKEILQGANLLKEGYSFTLPPAIRSSSKQSEERKQLIMRLKYLETLKLASYQGKLNWHIQAGLSESLQALGIASGQMKILERHQPLLTDKTQSLTRTELKQEGERITGIVLGAGLDPETDRPYLLIEGTDGKAHFVLQSPKLEEMRLQDSVKDGSVITLEVKGFTKWENGKEKRVVYQEVKNHNSAARALTDKALLDKEILSGLLRQRFPALHAENTGFAKACHIAVHQRAEMLEQHGMMVRMGDNAYITEKWVSGYGAFRAEEIRQEQGISAQISPWQKQEALTGTVLYSEPTILIIQEKDSSKCLYLHSTEERFSTLDVVSKKVVHSHQAV